MTTDSIHTHTYNYRNKCTQFSKRFLVIVFFWQKNAYYITLNKTISISVLKYNYRKEFRSLRKIQSMNKKINLIFQKSKTTSHFNKPVIHTTC